MCLSNFEDVSGRKSGYGWKVFIPQGKKFESSVVAGAPYKEDTWYQADGCNLSAGYQMGFHIWLRRKDAQAYVERYPDEVIKRIQFKRAFVQGDGGLFAPGRTIVAKFMKIIAKRKA